MSKEFILDFINENYKGNDFNNEIAILDKEIGYNVEEYNRLISKLKFNGVLFIVNNLPLVYQLVKEKKPILIIKEIQNISIVYKNNSDIHLSFIEKTKNSFYIEYINWYNNYANKNILAEFRFFKHIFYNNFSKEQKFL